MTPIQFPCPACKGQLKISNPALAGKKLKCPKCGAVVVAPDNVAETEAPVPAGNKPAPPPPAPVSRVKAAQEKPPPPDRPAPPPPVPRARSSERIADEPEALPSRRRPRPKGPDLLPPILVAVVAVLYVGALAAVFLGWADELLVGDMKLDVNPKGIPVKPPWENRFKEPGVENKLPPPDPAEAAQRAETLKKRLDLLQAQEKKLIAAWQEKGPLPALRVFLEGDFFFPHQVAVTADGKWLAATNKGKEVIVWDLPAGESRWFIAGGNDLEFLHSLAFSPDSRTLACTYDKKIILWDVTTGQTKITLPLGEKWGRATAFSPDGGILGGVGLFYGALLWDLPAGTTKPPIGVDFSTNFLSIDISPDGKTIILASIRNEVLAFDLPTGKIITCLAGKNEGGNLIKISPDGKFLAISGNTVTEPQVVRLINLKNGESRRLPALVDGVGSLSFSPDGKLLTAAATPFGKTQVKIWEVSTGKELRNFTSKEFELGSPVVFSAGGTMLFTANRKGIQVYAVETLLDEAKLQAALAGKKSAEQFAELLKTWANVDRQGDSLRVNAFNTVTDAQLAQLAKVPKIVRLDVQGADKLTDAGLVILKDSPNLEFLNLSGARGLTDAALAHVKGCAQLRELRLGPSQKFGDPGLAHLAGLTGLRLLDLQNTKVTDAGLGHLKGMVNLEVLFLRNTKITGSGLASVAGMANLTQLYLEATKFQDGGLAHLKGLNKLRVFNLVGTEVTDAGFEHLAALTGLEDLQIGKLPGLKGPGLKHLKKLTRIKYLNLRGTGITDEGLAHIKELNHLEDLTLPIQITDAGITHLAGLTKLRYLELTDLKDLKGPGLKHLQKLPNLSLNLHGTGITDDGLAHIKELTHLDGLTLPVQITDAGLAHLAGLTRLNFLGIEGLKELKGPGLKYLKNLPKLTSLYLGETGVTDQGLAVVRDLTQIKSLVLPDRITDAGLAHLKGLTNLETLNLYRTKVTDAGLVHLEGLTNLRQLDLGETRVTNEAVAALRKKLPKVNVQR